MQVKPHIGKRDREKKIGSGEGEMNSGSQEKNKIENR
jgi:hypothetical protein